MRFLRRYWRYLLGFVALVAIVIAVMFPTGPEPEPSRLQWLGLGFSLLGMLSSIWVTWQRHKAGKEHIRQLREAHIEVGRHTEQARRQLVEANVKIAQVAEALAAADFRLIAPNPTRPEKR